MQPPRPRPATLGFRSNCSGCYRVTLFFFLRPFTLFCVSYAATLHAAFELSMPVAQS